MTNIFSVFGSSTSALSKVNWANVLIYGFVALLVVLALAALIFFLVYKKRFIKVYEFDLVSHRVKEYSARIVKDKASGSERLWIGRYKRFVPRPSQENMFYKANKDALILVRENNGMLHTLRICNKEELIEIFDKLKGIDITQEFVIGEDGQKTENPYFKLFQIYSMPSPHEDLDWLGSEIEHSKKEYANNEAWWKNPNVMMIGTAAVCAIMFIMTLVIAKKM